MEFAILGPVVVHRDGEHLNLGGPKQRALLAMLLLQANEIVSRDRLIEGLWGERAPATASRSIDSYVSRLRGVLGSDRIERAAPGYRVRVEPGELDLDRFESLLDEGRRNAREGDSHAASRVLREATELWRGTPLADLVYEPFAAPEVARIEERRLLAVEERVQADLALGGGAELVGELERLVLEHPFRERLVVALMHAFYRAGRQKDALEAYEAGRRRLVTELGLEPGPELQDMQRKILEHDPSLDAPPVGLTEEKRPAPRPATRTRAAVVAAVAAVAVSVAIGIVLGTSGTSASPNVQGSNGLVSIRADSGDASVSIDLDAAPAAVAQLGGAIWLADATGGVVSQVDASAEAVVDRVRVQSGAGALVAGVGAIWTASVPGAEVARIDPATGTVTQTIPLGAARVGALTYAANRLWIADLAHDALIEVEPRSGRRLRTIPLELHPTALAASGASIWAADYAAGTIAELDAQSGDTVAEVHVGNGPVAIAVRPDAAWVVNSLDATVSRVDRETHAVVATIPIESGPSAVAATESAVWVANEYSGTVSRIDPATNAVADTSVVGGAPTSLTILDDEVWVGVRSIVQRRGGTLHLQHTRPISIDPALHLDILPPVSDDLTRDGLVTYNHVAGPRGTYLVPNLAVSIPAPTDGGRTYTFRLRRDIRYSDGRLVQAADFRRALERVFALGSTGKDLFTGIVGSDACIPGSGRCDLSRGITTNEQVRTVTFHLRDPDASFLTNLTVGGLATPVPPGTSLRPAEEPIPGTGPYMIASADEERIRYVRNPYFREWSRAAKPDGNPDEIVMRFDNRPKELVQAIEEGRADWITEAVPAELLPDLSRRLARQIHSNSTPLTLFFRFDTTLPPFDDVRVRQAVNYALDRRAIVRMKGGSSAATTTCQVLPPGLRGYRPYCPYTRNPHPDGRWRAPDLTRARRLVHESGTRGARVAVWGPTDDPGITSDMTRVVARALRQLGYRTRLCLVPSDFSRIPPGCDRQAIQLGWAGWGESSAYGFFGPWMSCRGAQNTGFCDRHLDRQMRGALTVEATDPRAAAAIWHRIDREITDEAVWLPLMNPRVIDFVSARVRNYQFHPYWGFLASQAWLE